MASLSPLTYGTIIWKAVTILGDTTDDVDEDPDVANVTGTATIKAVPNAILVPGSTPPATAFPVPITGTLVNGVLTLNGQPRIKVISTDSAFTNPTGFTYTVTFDLTYNGSRVTYGPLTGISVPAGQIVDLTLVAPASDDPGTPMDQAVSYYMDPLDSNVLIIDTP